MSKEKFVWMFVVMCMSASLCIACGTPIHPYETNQTDGQTKEPHVGEPSTQDERPPQETQTTELPDQRTREQDPEDTQRDYDLQKGIAYLRGRAESWHKSRLRDTSVGKSACLSCHTTFPYLLSRPYIKKHTNSSTLEETLFAQLEKRVARWDEAPAWYASSAQKIAESKGTEAVLNAVVLAMRDAQEKRTTPRGSTLQALDNLWKEQRKDGAEKGSWAWLHFGLAPFETKKAEYWGATLAAVAVGITPGGYRTLTRAAQQYTYSQSIQSRVKDLRTFLRGGFTTGRLDLHEKTMLLWAATTWEALLNKEEKASLIQQIQKAQQADGGWRLASMGTWKRRDSSTIPAGSDGYATGLVLYVLRLAGQDTQQDSFQRGLKWLHTHQNEDGSWPGFSLNAKRTSGEVKQFMPDTATAFALMALQP
tara:strand:+ start:1341 stop:2606 length:1266 start_codon:yes stop_codon:yes gene_type:complete